MKTKIGIPRYTMFGLLYFAQGSIMGYFGALNAIYFLSSGLTMTQAGLIGTIAMVPFILKIFLGMLSDKVNFLGLGHRKPYIVIGLVLQAGILAVFSSVNPAENFGLYAAAAFLLMTGMALYDTCTDGYALDITPEEEEGTVQAVMVSGRALGTVIIGGLGFIAQAMGWNVLFLVLALITFLPLPFVLTSMKEAKRTADTAFNWAAFGAFKEKYVIGLALLGALYSFCIYGAYEIVAPAISTEFGLDVGPTSLLISLWGIGVIAGGWVGGKINPKLGVRKSVLTAMLLSFAATTLLALILSPAAAWIIVPFFGIAFGYYETIFFALSMQFTDSRIAASMFAILMAIANIGTGIALGLAGVLVDTAGYRFTFLVLGIVNLLAIPLLGLMNKPAVAPLQEASLEA
jgi:MFS transporter, PAT family, beta-lactamase induction signal transducer AmpG